MRAAKQIQLASPRHLFYLKSRTHRSSQVDRPSAFCPATSTSTSFLVLESVDKPLWLDGHDIQAGSDGPIFLRKFRVV
jgi:hypothetical protein